MGLGIIDRPRHPPHIDVSLSHAVSVLPDELDEEFDTLPTSRSSDLVRMRYDRLRSIGAKIQAVVDNVVSQGERLQSLLMWRDPRATVLCMIIHLVAVIVVYVTPFKVVALLTGFYLLRHPRFRKKFPSILMNFSGDCLQERTAFCEQCQCYLQLLLNRMAHVLVPLFLSC